MRINKWYFATNVHGLRYAFDQMQVAVLSCARNTRLTAHGLVDDEGGDEETEARVRWLVDHGVTVTRHKASMVALLAPTFGEQMTVYGGHWLRCDIPEIERDEPVVLYTDIDVMFARDIPDIGAPPAFLACGPEHHRDDYGYFNSGVVIMNLPALRKRKRDLVEVVKRRLAVTAPYDDQTALNELYAGAWQRLPPVWNWKPYWGVNPEAIIVHFHGPKPAHATRMRDGEPDVFGTEYKTIYERDPGGYEVYCGRFADILAADG